MTIKHNVTTYKQQCFIDFEPYWNLESVINRLICSGVLWLWFLGDLPTGWSFSNLPLLFVFFFNQFCSRWALEMIWYLLCALSLCVSVFLLSLFSPPLALGLPPLLQASLCLCFSLSVSSRFLLLFPPPFFHLKLEYGQKKQCLPS